MILMKLISANETLICAQLALHHFHTSV